MFGYIVTDKPELKIREFEEYRSYYCGFCRRLKSEYGFSGELTLTYDMTFLVLLLDALYEPEVKKTMIHCGPHPLKKHPMTETPCSAYASDMNILLTWYSLRDDWDDEHKLSAGFGSHVLKRKFKTVSEKYPEKADVISRCLSQLHDYEQQGETDIDAVSGAFGHLMAEIFAIKKDMWEPRLRTMGFFLGKFIYIMDAVDDLEDDVKKDQYNPFKDLRAGMSEEEYYQYARQLLTMMIAPCCQAFEQLPILRNAEILRNILYSGVWTKLNIREQKLNEQKSS